MAFLPATDPSRGIEASPRPGKRRVFTPEQKARIVEESFTSGDSVCTVARRHGLMAAQLFAWRKHARLRREDPGFRRLRAEPPALLPAPDYDIGLATRQDAAPIEISIGSVTVRVPQGFDAHTLREVLEAIQGAA